MKNSIFLLGILLFAACSNDSEEPIAQQPPQEEKTYPLTIDVTENPMIVDGEENASGTRAAIETKSSLTAFYMNYVYNTTGSESDAKVTATKNVEGQWTSNGVWPSYGVDYPDANVTWCAYNDGTFYPNSGNPYINFTVVEEVNNQKDLLVANTSGTFNGTHVGESNKLSFTFDHACSALRFYVKKSTNLNSYTLSVSSIVLKNVGKKGQYFFNTNEWTLIENDITRYTLYSGSTKELPSSSYELLNGNENDSYLFLIPQSLTAWNHTGAPVNTYLEVACVITRNSDNVQMFSGTAYIPFAATLEKGTQYDVKINIGKNSLYKVEVNNEVSTASLIIQ